VHPYWVVVAAHERYASIATLCIDWRFLRFFAIVIRLRPGKASGLNNSRRTFIFPAALEGVFHRTIRIASLAATRI